MLCAAIAFWVSRNRSDVVADKVTRLSADDYLALQTELRNAIALLENFPFDGIEETYSAFEKLAARFPNERLPHRNDVIAKLLALNIEFDKGDPDAEEKKYNYQLAADKASIELMDFEERSPVSLFLRASFLLHAESGVPASLERDIMVLDLLKAAQSSDPENVVFPFMIYELADGAYDPDFREREQAPAIKRAYELAPNNASVVARHLIAQADAEDSTIGKTLADSRDLIMSLRKQVQRESSSAYDIGASYAKAVKGAAAGDWRSVRRGVNELNNRIKSQEVVKRDLGMASPHALEFVDYQFSSNIVATGDVEESLSAVEVTWRELALRAESKGPVVDTAIVDFTLDGEMELIVLTPSSLTVLKRESATQWRTLLTTPTHPGAVGLLIADLDADDKGADASDAENAGATRPAPPSAMKAPSSHRDEADSPGCYDADVDIAIYGDSGVELWRNVLDPNSGTRSLKQVAQNDAEWSTIGKATAAAFVDIDHDADLDIVVAGKNGVSIWSSQGAAIMQYYRLDEWSTLPPADVEFTSIRAVDWDRDVDVDLLLASPDGKTKGVLVNLRHARFAWTPLGETWSAMGNVNSIIPIEADGNVSWDAACAGPDGVKVVLTTTAVAGRNQFLREMQIDSAPSTGVRSLDFDNDGAIDLVSWNDHTVRLHRGLGNGDFAEAETIVKEGDNFSGLREVAAADVDGDGDLDLAIASSGGVAIFANEGGNKNHWVAIRARGQEDNHGRANYSGVGSLIELRSDARYQAHVVDSQVAHFGIGNAESASLARIIWTNGMPQDIIEPQGDVMLCEPMILKGSCPYLYTWDGEQYVFHTDCLWAAPLGMQVAEGVLAPTRPWEYLKIPGEKLKAKDGMYSIQLTEELWEIAYFDELNLIAVDHPADVDVFSNEKVGPPAIAKFKIHTVQNRRHPVSARDQRGRNILPTLLKADDRFVKAFDRKIYQGRTTRHYIELDLGDLKQPTNVKLFLRGWLRPTDTSLNVAFSQNDHVDAPEFPSVWVPDAAGKWQRTQPFMGFPGGKTKTIVVDLSQSFLSDDFRVRIESTAEVYWDNAFFTVDEKDAEFETTSMPVHSADLHYRGFSQRISQPHNAPYRYDYEFLTTHPVWPPVQGKFTRYGAVRSLLTSSDDQMVVLGAGDEMTVQFVVPVEPVRPGWKRDFMLHCVGFDKDADLNTVHGQSTGPLPYRAMTVYPYDREDGPQGAEYERYLNEFQTRQQNMARFWRRLAN